MDGDVCLGVWNSRGIPRIDGSGFLTKQKYIPGRERRPGSKKVFHDGERSTYIPLRASKKGITSCPSAEDALFTIECIQRTRSGYPWRFRNLST